LTAAAAGNALLLATTTTTATVILKPMTDVFIFVFVLFYVMSAMGLAPEISVMYDVCM